MYELQILLGLNCNFKCSHCLNDSQPGKKEYDLKDSDISLLITSISQNSDVTSISFSGGEPLLYLDKIAKVINSIRVHREDIIFSITTNGSLVEKNKDALSLLNIQNCLLSYDKEHSEFFAPDKFVSILNIAKLIFKNVEVNITYSESPSAEHIKHHLLNQNVKVHFTKKIESGRNKNIDTSRDIIQFKPLSCPNLTLARKKITYIPSKGFTICCGPLVFDKLCGDDVIFFKKFEDLQHNLLLKFLEKARQTDLPSAKDLDCHICSSIFKKLTEREIEQFLEQSTWANFLSTWSEEKLDSYNLIFNPKFVKKLSINSFKNYLSNRKNECISPIQKKSGSHLTDSEIETFSQFTIESFYSVHTNYYSKTDIKRFKSDQKTFFSLPYRYLYHSINNQIVAYLVVCKIENHPIFNEKVWHIGYWGITPTADRRERNLIKFDWATLLQELNEESGIVANIDYFNISAISMAEKFNFKTIGLRLDPRQ